LKILIGVLTALIAIAAIGGLILLANSGARIADDLRRPRWWMFTPLLVVLLAETLHKRSYRKG